MKKLNTLKVGELVTYKGQRGLVIYSVPTFNTNHIRLTVWWEGKEQFDFIPHLYCKRMKDPTEADIEFAKDKIKNNIRDWEHDGLSGDNLYYLELMLNLKPYMDKVHEK